MADTRLYCTSKTHCSQVWVYIYTRLTLWPYELRWPHSWHAAHILNKHFKHFDIYSAPVIYLNGSSTSKPVSFFSNTILKIIIDKEYKHALSRRVRRLTKLMLPPNHKFCSLPQPLRRFFNIFHYNNFFIFLKKCLQSLCARIDMGLNWATITDVVKSIMDVGLSGRIYLLNPSSWPSYHGQWP